MPEQKPTPGDAIRSMLTDRGWTHDDLARIIGRYRPEITNLISGKRSVTPELAIALGSAFDNAPEYWLELESARQLSFAREDPDQIKRRVQLYKRAPIRDVQKRGWISDKLPDEELEHAVCQFLEIKGINDPVELSVVTRKSQPLDDLTPAQIAWCCRARQIGRASTVNRFDPARLDRLQKKLRQLAAFAKEARHVSELLSEFGIRFMVIEPLPSAKIDGATFWLDDQSPVIAVSIKPDRMDAFWFTLMHEFMHVRCGDGLSVDSELTGENHTPSSMKVEMERRADAMAANSLVPDEELDSFIRRMSPLYAKPRIVQFAHRIKIHPGIIVGQLQFRGEVSYRAHKDLTTAKVRETVTNTAPTDGWGYTFRPNTI